MALKFLHMYCIFVVLLYHVDTEGERIGLFASTTTIKFIGKLYKIGRGCGPLGGMALFYSRGSYDVNSITSNKRP